MYLRKDNKKKESVDFFKSMLKNGMKYIKIFGLFLMVRFYTVLVSFHIRGNHIVIHL